jgi:hypothetical protein
VCKNGFSSRPEAAFRQRADFPPHLLPRRQYEAPNCIDSAEDSTPPLLSMGFVSVIIVSALFLLGLPLVLP